MQRRDRRYLHVLPRELAEDELARLEGGTASTETQNYVVKVLEHYRQFRDAESMR